MDTKERQSILAKAFIAKRFIKPDIESGIFIRDELEMEQLLIEFMEFGVQKTFRFNNNIFGDDEGCGWTPEKQEEFSFHLKKNPQLIIDTVREHIQEAGANKDGIVRDIEKARNK